MEGFPKATAAAIQEADLTDLPGTLSMGLSCAGAKFHSPRPLVLHEVPLPGGGTAYLCAVCRDNLRVLSNLVDFYNGNLPWRVRREFGNKIRSLVTASPEGNKNG